MAPPSSTTERDPIDVFHGQKWRPGYVLRVGEQSVIVICGTGTPRDLPHVFIDDRSRIGRAMRLTKPTYFYRSNVVVKASADVRPRLGAARCPLPVFSQLHALVFGDGESPR